MGTSALGQTCDNSGESRRMTIGAQKCRSGEKCEKDAKVSVKKMCNSKKCKSGCGFRDGKFPSTLKLAAMLVLVLLLVTDVNGDRNPNRARKIR